MNSVEMQQPGYKKLEKWYSAFHNVTAMVGAGVLSLPYAMSELGWYVVVPLDRW
jgi:amino acid permease